MPGATGDHDLPYPLGTDPINIAADIQALAEAVDDSLVTSTVRGATGSKLHLQAGQAVGITSLGGDVSVVFPTPFVGAAPIVTAVNIRADTYYFVILHDITNTGFIYRCIDHSGVAINALEAYIHWIAVGYLP
jgi:hypothetical protein